MKFGKIISGSSLCNLRAAKLDGFTVVQVPYRLVSLGKPCQGTDTINFLIISQLYVADNHGINNKYPKYYMLTICSLDI